jgi:hypothetical protein
VGEHESEASNGGRAGAGAGGDETGTAEREGEAASGRRGWFDNEQDGKERKRAERFHA